MHLLCATHALAPEGALSAQIPTFRLSDSAENRVLVARTGLRVVHSGRSTCRARSGQDHAVRLCREQRALAGSSAILCTGGPDVIQKEAWSFYKTSSGVRLCWELEEPKGPNGAGDANASHRPQDLSML